MVAKKEPSHLEIRTATALYRLGVTMVRMAELMETHRRRIPRILLAAGLRPRRTGELSEVGREAKAQAARRRRGWIMSPMARAKISASKLAKGELFAAGITVKASGYMYYTRGPNRGRSVHRVLMENKLGRKLLSSEHVHHVDRNRANNTADNLQVMTNAEHSALHGELEKWRQRA